MLGDTGLKWKIFECWAGIFFISFGQNNEKNIEKYKPFGFVFNTSLQIILLASGWCFYLVHWFWLNVSYVEEKLGIELGYGDHT